MAPRDRHADGDVHRPPAQATAGNHIVQIARTYFRPADPARALPFAPNGDFTLQDTLIRAIDEAREFIYIEDQYMTPPADYRTALLDALGRIQKLIIVCPGPRTNRLAPCIARLFSMSWRQPGATRCISWRRCAGPTRRHCLGSRPEDASSYG